MQRATSARPRIGFAGVGWIGRHRMQAIAESALCEITGIAEPQTQMAAAAKEIAPGAEFLRSFDDLLDSGLDGVVIATPSAMHASQTVAALQRGIAVFCQKPLGRNAEETWCAIHAARTADRLLGVDLSYRFMAGVQKIRGLIRAGELGHVYMIDQVFHNAYGPDKPWFYDPKLSGGGCVIDLGIHLADLALWTLDFPRVANVASRLFAHGAPFRADGTQVEDYATATFDLETGARVQLCCSWNAHAGRDAVIEASFHGTDGGARIRNVSGSFFDFVAERYRGTQTETLSTPPDAWGGRAAVDWAARLAAGNRFDPEIETIGEVAAVLDRIYTPLR